MSFWDRIKGWFSENEETARPADRPSPIRPLPGTVPVVIDPPNDLPSGDTGVDFFRLLFSNKDKHTTRMLNSISLSSDMQTLYLIDNGRAIPFDLTVPQGVLVGMLGDQLVVATGSTVASPDDTPLPDGETEGTRGLTKHIFKAGADSQFTLSYNGKNKFLSIIGHDDLVVTMRSVNDPACRSKVLSIDNQQVVRIIRREHSLEVTVVNL